MIRLNVTGAGKIILEQVIFDGNETLEVVGYLLPGILGYLGRENHP